MNTLEYLKSIMFNGEVINSNYYANVRENPCPNCDVIVYGEIINGSVFSIDAQKQELGVYIKDGKGRTIIDEANNDVFKANIKPLHCTVKDMNGKVVCQW